MKTTVAFLAILFSSLVCSESSAQNSLPAGPDANGSEGQWACDPIDKSQNAASEPIIIYLRDLYGSRWLSLPTGLSVPSGDYNAIYPPEHPKDWKKRDVPDWMEGFFYVENNSDVRALASYYAQGDGKEEGFSGGILKLEFISKKPVNQNFNLLCKRNGESK